MKRGEINEKGRGAGDERDGGRVVGGNLRLGGARWRCGGGGGGGPVVVLNASLLVVVA